MATKKSAKQEQAIDVVKIDYRKIDVCILGKSPIILNRMSEKTKQDLLMPKGRKTAADKASTLKHNPLEEFRNSPYTNRDADADTLLQALSVWFKKSLCGAAVDLPGATRSQMERLVHADGERIPLYGLPHLFMAVTRSADMNRTPDIRTRCIVPKWACRLTLSFPTPIVRDQTVLDLLAGAGFIQGVGDWRPQKGSGNYGQYELVGDDDPRYLAAMEFGREAQIDAMDHPIPYDDESADMLSWFSAEAKRRGFEVAA